MRVIQGLFSRWREAGNEVPACKERSFTSGDRKLLCREGANKCLCAAAGIRFRSASALFSGSHRGAMPSGCTIAELAVVGWSTINGFAKSGFRTAVPQVVTMFVTSGSASPCGPPHRGIASIASPQHRGIAPSHHRTTAPPHHREHGLSDAGRHRSVAWRTPFFAASTPSREKIRRTSTPHRRRGAKAPVRLSAQSPERSLNAAKHAEASLRAVLRVPEFLRRHCCSCRRTAGSYICAVGFRRNSFGSPSNSGASSAARSSDVTNVTPGRLTTSSELTP